MQRSSDIRELQDCEDDPQDDASVLIEHLCGAARDYELFDREWIAGVGP